MACAVFRVVLKRLYFRIRFAQFSPSVRKPMRGFVDGYADVMLASQSASFLNE